MAGDKEFVLYTEYFACLIMFVTGHEGCSVSEECGKCSQSWFVTNQLIATHSTIERPYTLKL